MASQTPDTQAVLERLEKLERQNRRFKLAGVVALIALGALVLMGQTQPEGRTIRAGEFDLVDASGRVRAKLGLDDKGKSPALDLYDAHGFAVATLYASVGRTGGLLLGDADSGANISLITTALVGPELRFGDTGGVRVALSLSRKTGDVSLVFYGKSGAELVTLDTDHMAFFDPDQPTGSPARILLQVLHGEPTLWLSRDGKVVWSAP
jgi:hypothetical protein